MEQPIKEISSESWQLVNTLIVEGWEFTLNYGRAIGISVESFCKENNIVKGVYVWECSFTRKLKNGLYDNHESGCSLKDVNKAIETAYKNIREVIKLKKRSN